MTKIDLDYIIQQYRSGIDNYTFATTELGLWESEQYVFNRYLKSSDRILDVGCGTGRTTYALHHLGFNQLTAIDLTPEMIEAAQSLSAHFGVELDFRLGDATALDFTAASFDSVIFSFNGLMSIPAQERRDQALREIWRVLKPEGYFLFTTHDRDKDENYLAFWQEQAQKWEAGQRDERLFQFGDLVTTSKNEEREIYIHIPSRMEVWSWLRRYAFDVVETFYRSDRFTEREAVRKVSGECRFWVSRKGR